MSHSDSRPTLPPIRDLFRDELSRHPDAPHESPSLPLARLSVSDDLEDRIKYPISSVRDTGRNSTRRMHGLPASDPYASHEPRDVSLRETPPNLPFMHAGYSSSQPTLPHFNQPASGYPRPSSSEHGRHYHQAHLLRSASYHEPHAPNFQSRSSNAPSAYPTRASPVLPYAYPARDLGIARHRSTSTLSEGKSPQLAWNISTQSSSRHMPEDDEQTPVARYYNTAPTGLVTIPHVDVHQFADENMGGSSSKYDCPYCGKGFNRPSSLKIHLNSHTGQKPFVCPVESCGRSFSVLSNMRRHARVHNVPASDQEAPAGGGSSSSPGASSSALPLSDPRAPPAKWYAHRRGSTSSSNASNSRRSRSISSNDDWQDERDGRGEPRSRRSIPDA